MYHHEEARLYYLSTCTIARRHYSDTLVHLQLLVDATVTLELTLTSYNYMYNHWGFGWACACAQSRPCLHWLCTKDIVVTLSESWSFTCVILYIYNHWGSGRACASAQFPPGLHWLNTIYSIGLVRHYGCYSLHIQSIGVCSALRFCSISTMPSLVLYKE